MIGQPHWFGVRSASFAMVHWPASGASSGVVICPPLGYEGVTAHPALRLIAESMSDEGVAVMRVDYPVTGNSLRGDHADDVAAWLSVIEAAVAELRAAGIDRIGLVGLRFGATLAAELAAALQVHALVLWDPVVSGRRYARGMRLLATATDDGIVAAGIHFDAATLTAISRRVIGPHQLTMPALVIARAEAGDDSDIGLSADAAVEVDRMDGTAALLDTDAELSVVPQPIVARISTWMVVRLGRSAGATLAAPQLNARTASTAGHTELVHEAVRLGPAAIFAVLSSASSATPRRAVIFLNNGVSPAVGPGSAWLGWADAVAGAGMLAVRMDFAGLGDSPARPGAVDHDDYPTTAAEDVSDVIDALTTRGIDRFALVGLCSGALLSFDAALRRSEIDQLVVINPRFDKPFHDRRHREVRAASQTNRFLAVPLHKAPLFQFFDKVPTFVWSALAALRLAPLPTLAAERVTARGTAVTMIFGPDELGMRAMRRRAPKRLAALEANPLVSINVVDSLDHSMFTPDGRRDVELALQRLFASSLARPSRSTTFPPSPSEVSS